MFPVTIPGYADVVNEPIDLSTVEKKLKAGAYQSTNQFAADIRKVWNNAWAYNKPGTEMYITTTKISEYFESQMKEVEDAQFTSGGNDEIQELKKKVSQVNGVLKKMASGNPMLPMQRASSTSSKKVTEKPMTSKEKAILGQNIRKLSPDQVVEMIQILRDVMDLSKAKEGLELDLEKLPMKKCRELEQFVKKALLGGKSKAKKKKVEAPAAKKAKEVDPAQMPMSTPASMQTTTPSSLHTAALMSASMLQKVILISLIKSE